MHDGYLFTLGVCGSASDTAILDAMLAALPPVKRAAYLGEVFVSAGPPSLDDPLTAPLLADVADAELLLIVTPTLGDQLPPRLVAFCRAVEAAALPPARRFAALVAPQAGLARLRQLCARAQITIVGELQPAEEHGPAIALARQAYAAARATRPDALPGEIAL